MLTYEPLRILFSFGSFSIYSWGLMFVVAFLVAFFLVLRKARKRNIKTEHIYNIAILVIIGAIVGSRLFFVFENLSFFIQNPLDIFKLTHGGSVSYGGIFLAIFFGWLYIRKQKDINFPMMLDLFAPYIALGLAIGRIGCFLNWCCYGQASSLPWAVSVAGEAARHPTQLYLMIANFIIFLKLIYLRKIRDNGKKTRFKFLLKKPGTLFLSFLIYYSILRFLIDFIRVYPHHFLGLAVSQWMLILIFIFSITALTVRCKKKNLK